MRNTKFFLFDQKMQTTADLFPSILDRLKTYANGSVASLAQQHRLSLTFVKWYVPTFLFLISFRLGHPQCTQDVAEIAKSLPTYLQMNVVPIICCQENEAAAFQFFSTCNLNTMVKHLIFVPNVASQVYMDLGLKVTMPESSSIFSKSPPTKQVPLKIQGKSVALPDPSVVDPFTEYGLFLVEKGGKLSYQWQPPTADSRPSYTTYMLLLEKEADCTLDDVEALKKLFPQVPKSLPKKLHTASPLLSVSDPHMVTLDQVMKDKTKRSIFKTFMTSEHCVENLIFIEHVEQYKAESKRDARAKLAEKIVATFFMDDSFMEINVDGETRNSILQQFKSTGPSEDLFDPLVKVLHATVLMDSFSRFKQSPLFAKVKTPPRRNSWRKSWSLFQSDTSECDNAFGDNTFQ